MAKEVRTSKYNPRAIKSKEGKGSFKRLKNVMTEQQWINQLTKGRE